MGSFMMPVPATGNARLASSSGPQLYGGTTGASGMPVPVISGPMAGMGKNPSAPSTPSASPAGTALPVAGTPSGTAAAPNLLTASPTPGTTPGTTAPNYTGSPANAEGSGSVLGENQTYYGTGMGALLTNYLQSGAGYNGALAGQAVSATDQAMQQQINQQFGGLQTALSQSGVSPDSSASALAQSNFLSNASAEENQVAAQQYTSMYEQSQSLYQNTLMQMAGVNAAGTNNQFGNLFSQGLASGLGAGSSAGLLALFGL